MATVNDRDLLQALKAVIDPELGIDIVELGLVCRAAWRDSHIEVALTPSTPSCPLAEMFVEEIQDALHKQFPHARSIQVELIWDPPWSPARLSEAARQQLGLPQDEPG